MTDIDDDYFMHQALNMAQKAAQADEVPVGAVVVVDGAIIGRGWNQPISSNDPTAHAEIMALRDAATTLHNYRLVNASLYVTIEPCTMCAGALIHARIQRLVFGAPELKSGVISSNGNILEGAHLNHRVEVIGNVLGEECSSMISDFFRRKRITAKTQ